MNNENNNKKYLLINPPVEVVPPAHIFSMQPFALLKIGKYLKDMGNEVYLIDCLEDVDYIYVTEKIFKNKTPIDNLPCGRDNCLIKPVYLIGHSYEHLESLLKNLNFSPDKIFIGTSMTYYYMSVYKVIDISKKLFPDIPVELGGIYPTLCPEHASRSYADKIHQGLFKDQILFKTDLSIINKTPEYAIIKFTRGCPNKCSYCAVSIIEGNKVIVRDLDDVINEMRNIINKFKIKAFHFWESSVLMRNKDYLKLLLKKIISNNFDVKLHFPEGFQISLVDNELVSLLSKCGVEYIHLPLENIDIDINKNKFHRNLNLIKIKKVIKIFQQHHIFVRLFCLIGFPEQSLKNVIETILFCWENECASKLMNFTPIPGTEEYNNYYDIIKDKDLRELDPALHPLVNKDMVEDLEFIYEHFEHRIINPHLILLWPIQNRVIKTMKKVISNKDYSYIKNPFKMIVKKYNCFQLLKEYFYKNDIFPLEIDDNKKYIRIWMYDNDLKEEHSICFEYKKKSKAFYKESKNFHIWYEGIYINNKMIELIDLIVKKDNEGYK